MAQPHGLSRREFFWMVSAALGALRAGAEPPGHVHVFGKLPPPESVRRVFAAGPPAAVLVYCLAPEKLMGWPWVLPPEARGFLVPEARNLATLGRLTGRGGTVPLERLIALRPDLILDCGTLDRTYLSLAEKVWRETGLPYVLVEGKLADSPRQLREAGHLLGVPARGEALAASAERILEPCGAAFRERTRVYLARGLDGLETALAGSINAEVVEAACGENVAVGPGSGLARVSREQLLAWNPEAVVTQNRHFFEQAQEDPFWRSLPPVRQGQLFLAPSLPFGWLDGPAGINRLVGVRWLKNLLLPGNRREDTADLARTFYSVFYHHEPAADQIAKLYS